MSSEESLRPGSRVEKSEGPETGGVVVDPEWWKHIFDSLYMVTDARSIDNDQVTAAEADLVERFIPIARDEPLLDLCGGQARHALALARRGYTGITTLDYSAYLLDLGKNRADSLPVHFVRADARVLPLADSSYRAVAMMACSFGYSPDDRENAAILREAWRVLGPGGMLLLDVPDAEKVLKNISGNTWHQANEDIFVMRSRRPAAGGLAVRELVVSRERGLLRETNYFEKLYSHTLIRVLVMGAGFKRARVYRGLKNLTGTRHRGSEPDLGFMSSRMIVTALKPGK
ncbi:MAG: class I SAM-dependent methyltransferase, partial [Gemmatimonadota bacterium]|nr:class I SAM-dependent methyltransferase [Gemmatimonadota bacterium]